MSQTETSPAATPGAASLASVNLSCPTCCDTTSNPDAPSEIADDGDSVTRARLSAAALSEPTAEAGRAPPPGQAWPRMPSTMSQTETSPAATPGAASLASVNLPCPTCRGTTRNPESPSEIVEDDGTCLVCCNPAHPWHSARHGWVGVPCAIVADPVIRARLSAAALSGPTAEAGPAPPPSQAWPRMSSTMSQTETFPAATPGTASLPGVTLPCPTCCGTTRNPDAPSEIADDDGTCLVCCNPAHPWHAARLGWVEVPCAITADPVIRARLSAAALSGPTMDP